MLKGKFGGDGRNSSPKGSFGHGRNTSGVPKGSHGGGKRHKMGDKSKRKSY